MFKGLFFILFLIPLASFSQADSIRLVGFESTECEGIYSVKPGFIRNETIGDTTFVRLFCSNNCEGFHDPKVLLQGDSVQFIVAGGKREIMEQVYYKSPNFSARASHYFLNRITSKPSLQIRRSSLLFHSISRYS